MAEPQPTDTDRLTALEQHVQVLQGRIAALEAREGQAEAHSTSDPAYLTQQIFGAVEGSQKADSLNHFQ